MGLRDLLDDDDGDDDDDEVLVKPLTLPANASVGSTATATISCMTRSCCKAEGSSLYRQNMTCVQEVEWAES